MRDRTGEQRRNQPDPIPLLVRTTSPMQFLAAMLIGAWLQQALALPLPQGRTLAWMQLAGGVVAAAGLLLSLRCLALFVQRRTTVLPERAPSSLVVRGPYRYSRNPMYLSLLLSYVGLCVQIGWPWALLLPLPLLALQRVLIPFEETRLRERFGSAYVRYCAQVRRWL